MTLLAASSSSAGLGLLFFGAVGLCIAVVFCAAVCAGLYIGTLKVVLPVVAALRPKTKNEQEEKDLLTAAKRTVWVLWGVILWKLATVYPQEARVIVGNVLHYGWYAFVALVILMMLCGGRR